MKSSIDRLEEIEMLLDAYEGSGMATKEFSIEFFNAVQMIIRKGIPARELRLCVQVPFTKGDILEDFRIGE